MSDESNLAAGAQVTEADRAMARGFQEKMADRIIRNVFKKTEELEENSGNELAQCFAAHRHASVEQAVAELRKESERLYLDLENEVANRDAAETAMDHLTSEILGEPIDWPDHQAKWREATDEAVSVQQIAELRCQLAAEKEGMSNAATVICNLQDALGVKMAEISSAEGLITTLEEAVAVEKSESDRLNTESIAQMRRIDNLCAKLVMLRDALTELVRQYEHDHGMGDIEIARVALKETAELTGKEAIDSAELAALRKDNNRLEWLTRRNGYAKGKIYLSWAGERTIREAIDVSMAAETAEREAKS